MSCRHIQSELSAYLDRELGASQRELVAAHLQSCAACAAHLRQLQEVQEALSSLPRLSSGESLAARVLDRLEVESRGPGLALLFRSALGARPLMVPSLLPAAIVVVCTLSMILSLGARDMRSTRSVWDAGARVVPSSTDAYLFASEEGDMPQSPEDVFFDQQLQRLAQETIFVETFVGKDGRVSYVKLIDGDRNSAMPILHEMVQQRCVPGRGADGLPAATRSFRLISAIEVRAPRT